MLNSTQEEVPASRWSAFDQVMLRLFQVTELVLLVVTALAVIATLVVLGALALGLPPQPWMLLRSVDGFALGPG